MFQIDRKLQFALVLPVLLCSSCAISLGIGVGDEEHHWEEHEEEWEERHVESHYCVVINDGASGVVVDGEVRCCSCT